jgi:hypothetical protein
MKEFASVEMRRREIDTHKQAQKKRERDTVCSVLLCLVICSFDSEATQCHQ